MEQKKTKIEKDVATKKKQRFNWQDFVMANFKTVIGLSAVIVLAIGYFAILGPKYADIKAEIAAEEEKKAEKDGLEGKLSDLKRLKKQYEEINKSDLDKIDNILPSAPGKDDLLSQLESLILRNGLLLTSLNVEEVKEAKKTATPEGEAKSAEQKKDEDTLSPDIGKVRISMDLVGTDYTNLKRILTVIENNERLLDVTKVSFSPDTDKSSLEMLAYYLKKKAN